MWFERRKRMRGDAQPTEPALASAHDGPSLNNTYLPHWRRIFQPSRFATLVIIWLVTATLHTGTSHADLYFVHTGALGDESGASWGNAFTGRQDTLPAAVSGAQRLFVDASALGDESGGSWGNAFTELQDALSFAGSGDEIWVACATYLPTESADDTEPRSASFFVRSGVSVFGGFLGGEETLDERNPDPQTNGCSLGVSLTLKGGVAEFFHIMTIEDVADPVVIDGFSVVGGRATGPIPRGAGMRIGNANVTLRHVSFDDVETVTNGPGFGGAVFAQDAQLLFEDVSMTRCRSGRGGGVAAFGGQLTVRQLTVSDCVGGFGGGPAIYMRNSATADIADSSFENNIGANQGGAILNDSGAPLTISRSSFLDNRAGSAGGAIAQQRSNRLIIDNSVFVGNFVSRAGPGGAIRLTGSTQATITNSTIVGNEASTGGGVAAGGSTTLAVHNSILFGNLRRASASGEAIPQLEIDEGSAATATVTFSIVQEGFPGAGNLALDPEFAQTPDPGDGSWRTRNDNDLGNVRITITSPAIDAGDNLALIDASGVITGTAADLPFDADLRPRVLDVFAVPDAGVGDPPVIDIGAFEFNIEIFRDGFEAP